MEDLVFTSLVMLYICLVTGVYVVYFIAAFKFAHPTLRCLIQDEDTADMIFFAVFWFAAGIILIIVSLSAMDNIVSWINSPWLNNLYEQSMNY